MWKDKFPRVNLTAIPTPIEKMERLNQDLKGVELYIKRDDLTGLAFGGNKARKLEYLFGEGQKKGCRTVVTQGGAQSNHARMTAAAAAKLGWEAVLVLAGSSPHEEQGNVLLDGLLGARIVWTEGEKRSDVVEREVEKLAKADKKVLNIPTGGSTPLGSLGYLKAAEEIAQQEKELGVKFDYIVAPAGSGGTHAGLLFGKYMYNLQAKIMGIAADDQDFGPVIGDLFNGVSELLGVNYPREEGDLILTRDYVGPGYGQLDETTLQAVKYLALREGIIVGPVYTGKALAGVLDLTLQGFFPENSKILFVHTGGNPEVFAYSDQVGRRENA